MVNTENNFTTKTYIVDTQKKRFIETVLLSNQNMLKLIGQKIFTILPLKLCLPKPKLFSTEPFWDIDAISATILFQFKNISDKNEWLI